MVETDSISLAVMAVGSLSYLLAMLGGIAWLGLRYSANFRHMGLSLRKLLPNTGLGLAAAAMTLPLVGLLNWAVSKGMNSEYDHPLINELQKEGTVSGYLLAVFCAVFSGTARGGVLLSSLAARLVAVGAVECRWLVVAGRFKSIRCVDDRL